MPGFAVTASIQDCWRALSNTGSWTNWWVLGAPQIEGDLGPGAELVWPSEAEGAVRATVEKFEPPNFLHIRFTTGDDGLPHKRGTTVQWDFDLYPAEGGTEVWLIRRAGKPVTKARSQRALHEAEQRIGDAMKACLEGTAAARGDVPDIARLASAKDCDALIAALSHPEPFVRGAAVTALAEIEGDPRVVDAIAGVARDPDWSVRKAVVHGLVKLSSEQATSTLLAMTEDEHAGVRELAKKEAGGLIAAFHATRTRGYTEEERRRLREAPGPKFGPQPAEVFLGVPIARYLLEFEVFDYSATETEDGSTVTVKIAFPPVCSGCLESTERSEIDIVRRFE